MDQAISGTGSSGSFTTNVNRSFRRHDAELGKMFAQGSDKLGPLPHQKIRRPEHERACLRLLAFGCHEAHGRTLGCLASRLGSMNLEDTLCYILSNRAKLTHGRLPQVGSTPPFWHTKAVGASTPSEPSNLVLPQFEQDHPLEAGAPSWLRSQPYP
jgi:hypothetical protein